MSEHPILFSGGMVRAILDGRKTQTRRPVKPYEFVEDPGEPPSGSHAGSDSMLLPDLDKCPYGRTGDRLWVRETFQYCVLHRDNTDEYTSVACSSAEYKRKKSGHIVYRADEEDLYLKWRPSIHMPRWASRIWLEVVSVRVERLNRMSLDDMTAEGMDDQNTTQDFMDLWNRIYANRGLGWKANPMVWVVAFRVGRGE